MEGLGEFGKDQNKRSRDWVKKLKDEKAFGDIPIISDIGYVLSSLLAGFTSVIINGLEQLVIGLINLILDMGNEYLLDPALRYIDQMIDFLVRKGLLDANIKQMLDDVLKGTGKLENLIKVFAYREILYALLHAVVEVSNVTTQQSVLNTIKPMIPNVDQLIRLGYIFPENKAEYNSILGKYGYDDKNAEMMYDSAKAVFNELHIQNMFWRGKLDLEGAINQLMRTGYTREDATELISTWEIIPSIQDILWMVGKEAFEQDQIDAYGLDDEFPEDQKEWLDKLGLSEFWQKKYWNAHWSFPSPQQVLEMLHRGKITREEVYQYYRVVEMPPFWREKLMDISYNTYTRVDLRRMEQLGIVEGMEPLTQGYMEQGYDLEHATNMAKFTVKYNQRAKTDLTKNRILDFYTKGIVTEQDVILFLTELGYSNEEIEYHLRDAKLTIRKEYIDALIDSTEELYVNNEINTGEVFSRLNSVRMSAEKIDTYIDKWNVIRSKSRKHPSKEDLMGFFTDEIISENDFIVEMGYLGYSRKYIGWYLKSLKKKEK